MKKQRASKTGRFFKRIFNFRAWLDWDRIREYFLSLLDAIKHYTVPQKAKRQESFEQALQRFHVTEEDLLHKQRYLYRLALMMSAAALLIFCYAVYNLISSYYLASLISLVVMMVALILAFRYHFWYYQIRVRKLGCSFQEWFKEGLLGERK